MSRDRVRTLEQKAIRALREATVRILWLSLITIEGRLCRRWDGRYTSRLIGR